MPELSQFKNIAIIQTAFLGDVALALPLVQVIRNYMPESRLTFVTTPIAASLVSISNAVDNVVVYDKRDKDSGLAGLRSIGNTLKQKKVECILAPHRSLRTSLLVRFANPVYSVGFDRNAFSFMYKSIVQYNTDMHETDRNLSLLKAFTDYDKMVQYFKSKTEVTISLSDIGYVDKLTCSVVSDCNKLVLLAPGSVWNTKKWREEYFIELAKMLLFEGFSCLLIGSRQDEQLCRFIAGNSGAINLAGQTTLPQTIQLMTKAAVLITNDSAPTHLAGIAGCPAVTIFGPTVPEFGFAPMGQFDKVIQNNELSCRPCRIHGSNKCPIRTHECMTSIMPDRVLKEILEIVSKSNQNNS